jgi:peptidoglycan/LPS O-acetylase OafA/YrhL
VTIVGRQVPALDGVRGIAVILVMGFHIWRAPITALGWSGVDLFFVLSGFLITGIVWDTRDATGRARAFYVRRALRILPLYYAVLVGVFVARPLLGWNHRLDDVALAPEQIWYWTYLCDWRIALGHPRAFTFLTHLWSLSIEEQFYLVWPFVVWHCTRRRAIAIATSLILLACALRVYVAVWTTAPGTAYGLLPCRADALAIGAIVALALRGPGGVATVRRWLFPLAALGLVAGTALTLIRPTVRFDDVGMITGGYMALDWAYAGLVFLAATTRSSLLEARPLRAAGRISYGLYVFHPLVMWWIVRDVPWLEQDPMRFAAGAAVGSLVIAWLSYRFYESPFLRLKQRWARLSVVEAPGSTYQAAA